LRIASALFGAGLVIALVLYWAVPQDADVAPTPQRIAAPKSPGPAEVFARVREVSGQAQLLQADRRVPLQAGDALADGQTVTTDHDARLVVEIGGNQIVVDSWSKVRVRKPSQTWTFELLDGRAEGHAAIDVDSARISFVHDQQVIALRSGAIGIIRVSAERLAIAALNDAVLDISGRAVELPKGHLVRLRGPQTGDPGEVEIAPLPQELLLSLEQKALLKPEDRSVGIAGRTDPDVILIINDRRVRTDAQGRFMARLSVSSSTQVVRAQVKDPAGRVLDREFALTWATTRTKWKTPG
jgi:hypothetical protein